MRRFGSVRAVLVAAALAATACGDEGPVSEPGTLTASVVSPNGDEGAAVVLLLGDGIGTISSFGDTEAWAEARPEESQARVVLVHPTGGILTFQVAVEDVTEPPSVVIEEVAGPDDALRADVSTYMLEFVR
jgi:hypothetical protein